mgnify:CR=1 FL=1
MYDFYKLTHLSHLGVRSVTCCAGKHPEYCRKVGYENKNKKITGGGLCFHITQQEKK